MTTILIILGIIALAVIMAYNSFIRMRNRVQEAFADIEVQLKRRYDLVPNLVETVKGYAKHEKDVFDKVSQARSMAMGAKGLAEKAEAENYFSETLKSLFAVSEAYPELKANQNFLELQRELVDTEDKIQSARRFYNGAVRDFNTAIQSFPGNILAGIFRFKQSEMFETKTEAEKEPIQVKF
ncbi:MAG: LemA family protein [Patescibacteria group bacterium]